MEISLSVLSNELDPEELQFVTRKLCQTLRDEAGLDVRLASSEAAPGTKGDIPLWGQIVVTLIGSSGLAAAIKALGDYVSRSRKIEVSVKTPHGEITIKTENADDAKLLALLQPVLTSAAEAKQLPAEKPATRQLSE